MVVTEIKKINIFIICDFELRYFLYKWKRERFCYNTNLDIPCTNGNEKAFLTIHTQIFLGQMETRRLLLAFTLRYYLYTWRREGLDTVLRNTNSNFMFKNPVWASKDRCEWETQTLNSIWIKQSIVLFTICMLFGSGNDITQFIITNSI